MYDSVNLRSPSPDVDGVSNFPYTSSTSEPTDNRRLAAVSRPSMMDEKLAKQIEQHKKRWKEHPEECPAEINSMSDEEVYEGIRNCTFLDTEIPGESREEFVRRLKKEKSKKINKKISEKDKE